MRRSLAPLSLLLALSTLPVACAVEEADDDGSSGTSGTTAGSSGKAGSAGSGGSGTAGSSSKGGSSGTTSAGGAGSGGSTNQGGAGLGGSAGSSGSAGTLGGTGVNGGSAGSSAGSDAAGGMFGGAGSSAGSGGAPQAGAAGASGAAGGGKGGSAGGGTTGFDPCPSGMPCKILPLGDSITDGIGFAGGYRVELFHLALEDDKNITFVGGSMNGPNMVDGQTFPKAHEGHSGWTIEQIDGITPSPALTPMPNIVLLHIGTNDMYRTPQGAPDRLGALIDQIITQLPDALLVVSNIIPFPQGASAVMTYNAAVPGVVNMRKEAGKHIIFVDQFMGFPTSELGDGVHPNQAGYSRMAGVWYAAISSYLH